MAARDRVAVFQSHLTSLPSTTKPRYSKGDAWRNWAEEEGSCVPADHVYPESATDVARAVKSTAARPGAKLRVAGSGLSYNRCTFTSGTLLHTDGLNRVMKVDAATKRVQVQAGVVLKNLCADLDARNLSLPVVPTLLDGTVGGSIAVAAHGSGLGFKSLSAIVVALTVVDGTGTVISIDERTPIPPPVAALLPPGHETTTLLDAYRCNLGVLGVVVDVTLQCEAAATVHVVRRPVSVKRLDKHVAQRATVSDYYLFWWTPHTDMCFETVAKRCDPCDDERASSVAASVRTTGSTGSKSRNAQSALTAISTPDTQTAQRLHWVAERRNTARRALRAVKGPWLRKDATEYALAVATAAPAMQPTLNKGYQRLFMNEEQEEYGPLHSVMTMQSAIKQHAMEFAVAADHWRAAFAAAQQVIEKHQLKVHFPVEVRFVDEESSWMAPNYRRKTCYIGLVMYKPKGRDAVDWRKYYESFEAAVTPLGARPHWSKYTTWGHREFRAAYPMLPAFTKLQEMCDPHKVLSNPWWAHVAHP